MKDTKLSANTPQLFTDCQTEIENVQVKVCFTTSPNYVTESAAFTLRFDNCSANSWQEFANAKNYRRQVAIFQQPKQRWIFTDTVRLWKI